MIDRNRVLKLVAMLTATNGEAANAAAMLSKIAAAEKLSIGELFERVFNKDINLTDPVKARLVDEIRASWQAAEMWRAEALRLQATQAPETVGGALSLALENLLRLFARPLQALAAIWRVVCWVWDVVCWMWRARWGVGLALLAIAAVDSGLRDQPAAPAAPVLAQAAAPVAPAPAMQRPRMHDKVSGGPCSTRWPGSCVADAPLELHGKQRVR